MIKIDISIPLLPVARESSVGLPSWNKESTGGKIPLVGISINSNRPISLVMRWWSWQHWSEVESYKMTEKLLVLVGRAHRWRRTGNTPNKRCLIHLRLFLAWLDLSLSRRRALNPTFPKKEGGQWGDTSVQTTSEGEGDSFNKYAAVSSCMAKYSHSHLQCKVLQLYNWYF